MAWHQIRILTDSDNALQWEDVLFALGAVSVTFEDAEDQPILEPKPGEAPLWNKVTVQSLFEEQLTPELVDEQLNQWDTLPACTERHWSFVEDQAWERVWLDSFKPMKFGEKLWIIPSEHHPVDPHATNIFLDPGLAFGTGTHPTTAQCLAWLDGQQLQGKQAMDYGCGSGILAIAAALLGAARVNCVDIDEQAITATLSNADNNQVSKHMCFITPETTPEPRVDLLMANILAYPLMELMPFFYECVRPGGDVILSGILEDQADAVVDKYTTQFTFVEKRQQDEWVFLHFTKA